MDSGNALLEAEQGRDGDGSFEVMVDSGDHQTFNITAKPVWSGYKTKTTSFAPRILADGIVAGENLLTPDSGAANDAIDFAAMAVNLQGAKYSIAAGDLAVTFPVTDPNKVVSICAFLSTGTPTIVEVEGTENAGASTVRGAAGGPPFIPALYVEIGQVVYTATGTQVVTAAMIQQTAGVHTELATSPEIKLVNNVGEGLKADTPVKANAFVEFTSAMDLRHTASTAKGVYARVYEPLFSEIPKANNFKGAFISVSGSSEQVYQQTISSKSFSLSDGSYDRKLNDGVTDFELKENGRTLTYRFYPDGAEDPHQLVQAAIGIDPSYAADANIAVTVTLVSEVETALFAS
jgi:hypothetical protein